MSAAGLSPSGLPTGRRGQALAGAITLVGVAAIWLGVVSPVIGWYGGRRELLQEQRALAVRMASVGATAPALQRELAQADAAPPPRAVFDGATDAIAGASLQQAVQDMASRAGATVLSAEMLPVQTVGSYHRIGIRVTISATWPVLISLLGATLQATPRMLVDDLSIRQTAILGVHDARPMEAAFTVTALHVPVAASGAAEQ